MLEDLFAGRPVNIPQMLTHLSKVATELGLPFGKRKKTYNSRLAQELGKLAESQGKGDEFHHAVFRAYFAEGLNIGNVPTLAQLGSKIGLSEKMIGTVLETRAFKEAVDADWARSYQLGVTAVPTFMINHRFLVGAQPYDALAKWMDANNISRRNSDPSPINNHK